jgi:hypothetical protein
MTGDQVLGLLSAGERAEWPRAGLQRRLELVTLAGLRARGVARGDQALTQKDIPDLELTGMPRAGADVPDRTTRRRRARATVRAGRVDSQRAEDRAGRFDPATGLWSKVCPYCKREFQARRRDAVTCGRPNCRKRYSRRRV